MTSEWIFNPIVGGPWVGLLTVLELAVLAGSLYWAASAAVARTSASRRAILFALRLAIIAMVLIAMLRPTHVFTEKKKQPSTLIVMLDRSRSMQVADASFDKTRWEALTDTIKAALPQLHALQDEFEIKLYTFDSEVNSLEFTAHPEFGEPGGKGTAIGASFEDIRRQHAGKRLAGMILISDGAQQAVAPRDLPPHDAVRRLAELGCPLYTIAIGQSTAAGSGRDVAIENMPDDLTVFVKNELAIRGDVRISGLQNQDVPVEMLLEDSSGKMTVIGRTVLKASADFEKLPIALTHLPQTDGEFKLTLRAAQLPRELDSTNNELSTFVTVRKGGLNVLYIEGEPRFEQRFLRRSLNASPDIRVDFQWFDHRDRERWPINLAEKFVPGKYDVYIIGDIDAAAFRTEDLEALRKAVNAGAGLIMLGGFHTFWSGGYLASPLAAVLPLRADLDPGQQQSKLRRQKYDEAIRVDGHLLGQIAMTPDPRFATMPMLSLPASKGAGQAWKELPPLEGINKFYELKDTAKTLLIGPNKEPILVADEAQAGRVLAFAGDSTWRWNMRGFGPQHRQFWRQVILWLARKDDEGAGNISVAIDKRRYQPGERVQFTVEARNAQGELLPGVTYEATVSLPGGDKRPVRLAKTGTTQTGSFLDSTGTGDYTLVVTAKGDGPPLNPAKLRFLVYDTDLEMSNAAARPTMLAALSKMTSDVGGRALAPEQLGDLLRELKEKPPDNEVESQIKRTPWDTWEFFMTFVTLLTAEWYLRKKWGLV